MKHLPAVLEVAGASLLIVAGFVISTALGLALFGVSLLAAAYALEH